MARDGYVGIAYDLVRRDTMFNVGFWIYVNLAILIKIVLSLVKYIRSF